MVKCQGCGIFYDPKALPAESACPSAWCGDCRHAGVLEAVGIDGIIFEAVKSSRWESDRRNLAPETGELDSAVLRWLQEVDE